MYHLSHALCGSRRVLCALILVLALAIPQASGLTIAPPSSSFWNTDMRLCDVDAQGNCNYTAYISSIIRYGIGGLVAAALSLLAFLVFIPVRALCGGFGGKRPSFGICPSTSNSRDYTPKEILAVKIAVVLVCIPIIIGVAIGYQANSDISSSVHSVTNSMVVSGDNIVQSLLEIKQILLSLPITSESQLIIDTTVNYAISVDNNLHSVHNNVNQYDQDREIVMVVGFAFSLALVIIGLIALIFNWRPLAYAIAVVSFLVLTLVWVSFGIHLVADKFVFDACVDINILESNSNTTSVLKTGALANLWDCGANSDFTHIKNLVNSAIGVAANDTCAARSQLCSNDPNWQCAQSPACGPDTLLIVTDGQHLEINDNGVNRTLQGCAMSCTNGNYKNESITLLGVVSQYTNFTNIYNTTLIPLVTCEVALQAINGFKQPMCTTLFDSIYGVAVSNLIVGIFYVGFIILMVVGYKRFRPLDYSAV